MVQPHNQRWNQQFIQYQNGLHVIDNPSNYSSAESQCELHGTYLGTIRDLSDSEEAYRMYLNGDSAAYGNCWFGYHRINAEWQWKSPEAQKDNITYTRWGNNEPSGENCARIWPTAQIPGYDIYELYHNIHIETA